MRGVLVAASKLRFREEQSNLPAMTVSNVARRLNVLAGAAHLPPLILMTDETRLADPLAAAETLVSGSAVVLRHYDAPGRRALAENLVAIARRRGLTVLIGADARLAGAVGADGLHLPEHLARRGIPAETRARFRLITAAAHSRAGLVSAARAGADAALLGPVFATASHPEARPIGAVRFAAWCRAAPLPVYALGGIDAVNARRLLSSGAAGIAAIGGLIGAAAGGPGTSGATAAPR
jgi:thiamine-phosphate pyrophosphorylase